MVPSAPPKSAVEKHGVFATEKFCDLAFEFAVQIGHAGKHGRTAGAEAVGGEGVARGGDHLGMIGEPEIIIGTEIDDGLRLAVVRDCRARVGRGTHLRFVKFDRPRAACIQRVKLGGA